MSQVNNRKGLFYSNKLSHFAGFASNLASNLGVTYLANKIAGEDRFSTSATILSMGDIKGMFGGGDSGKEEKDGFIANLESHVQQDEGILSIGLLGKNAGSLQSGGGTIDLTLSTMKDVLGDMRAVGFQLSNSTFGGDEGRARLTYVNTGVLSGNKDAEKTARDIFNGDKDLKFDIREEGHLGHAGDRATNDTSTIHLNLDAGKLGQDGRMDNNQLATYTGTMSKEGAILDKVVKNNEWQKEAVLESSGNALQAQAMRDNREQMSFQVMDGVLNDLDKNLGVRMSDSGLRNNITKAANGDMSAFDTASGDDFMIIGKARYIDNPNTGLTKFGKSRIDRLKVADFTVYDDDGNIAYDQKGKRFLDSLPVILTACGDHPNSLDKYSDTMGGIYLFNGIDNRKKGDDMYDSYGDTSFPLLGYMGDAGDMYRLKAQDKTKGRDGIEWHEEGRKTNEKFDYNDPWSENSLGCTGGCMRSSGDDLNSIKQWIVKNNKFNDNYWDVLIVDDGRQNNTNAIYKYNRDYAGNKIDGKIMPLHPDVIKARRDWNENRKLIETDNPWYNN